MKKVAVVLTSTLVVAVGAVAPTAVSAHASAGAHAAAVGPSVTVQIKTMNKTLLAPKKVHGGKGWITKGKTPTGKHPARQVPRQQRRRRTQRGDARPLDRHVLQERRRHLHHVDSRGEAGQKGFLVSIRQRQ